MAYTKTSWVDRSVQYPQRFTRTSDGTYDTLVPQPGTITNAGTPITAAALNNLETQYDQAVAWAKLFGLGDVAEDVSNTNINSIDATGFYKGLNMPSAPTGDSYFIINIKYDANNRFQQVHQSTNGNNVWRRFQNAGVWGAWDTVISASSMPSQLGGNGYQKLPSGLIIQWGSVSAASGTATPVTFPIAFPNNFFVANPSALATSGVAVSYQPNQKTGMNVYQNSGGSVTVVWVAIGN